MKLKLLTVFSAFFFLTQSNATTYYVNASATGSGNGLSWSNAFTDIQSALSVVIFGDEIWVAAGQYKPTSTTSRTVAFVLKNGVNIYGGFVGTETNINQRDIDANPTTLNGDIGQTGLNTDNSHNIIRANTITSNIVLDGFRIINGNSGSSYGGGAIKISSSNNGNLLVKNCYFFSNKAYYYGGAIHLENSNVTIENCEFRNNSTVGGEGGAVYTLNNGDNSSLTIKDSKFIGNSSMIGACLANSNTYESLIIDRCIFTNNTSTHSIVVVDHFLNAKISNSLFVGNTVNNLSGTVIEASHYANSNVENFELVNCTIAHNYNLYSNIQGEMISLYKSYYKIRNCIIYGNTKYEGRQINTFRDIADSLIEGGYANSVNVINSDPQFVNPNTTVGINFDVQSYNYSVATASPAVDAGNNTFVAAGFNQDLNNSARIYNNTVDMGAYEQSSLSTNISIEGNKSGCYFNYNNSQLIFTNYEFYQGSTVEIYSVDGKMIKSLKVSSAILDLDIETGLYILKLKNNQTLKIVIK